jgi:hypothetical protein
MLKQVDAITPHERDGGFGVLGSTGQQRVMVLDGTLLTKVFFPVPLQRKEPKYLSFHPSGAIPTANRNLCVC